MKESQEKKRTEQVNIEQCNIMQFKKEQLETDGKNMESQQHKVFVGFIGIVFGLFCVLVWTKTDEEYSISERRMLKQMPECSMESLLSGRFMSAFEEYSLDQFPFRDDFRSMKAMTTLKLDNNGIYVVEDEIDGKKRKVICDMDYPLNEDSLQYASKRFQNVYDLYLKNSNCQVYLSIIPDKNYFYAKEHGYLAMDYDELVDIMSERNTNMTYIDIFPYLSGEDYYRTDIHWRQEKLADVADVLLGGMGQGIDNSKTEVQTVEGDFYGVYHGQAAMPIEPDTLQYLTNDTIEQMKVFDYQNNKEIPVYDKAKTESDDPYEMYVGGPISLATIENSTCDNGKNLIIFRDSFGSSIAPLLAQEYEKTTLIDIRYILPSMLEQYVDFQDADVLFLYSTPVLNHSDVLK